MEATLNEDTGYFTNTDRKTLITVEVELGHVRELLTGLAERLVVLERDHVTQSQIRTIEVDVDELRAEKADKGILAELRVVKKELEEANNGLKEEIKELQKWRWFERGIVASVIALGELLVHINWGGLFK